ncbi:30S ribosome-binding factor RbfA [Tundrisphaera sp. TA3]|uniref:30S ribosome-binding factor RbfA n=1 Tax=Tundrisphaera sp. TA3 TaxID=3435775 RepID=UPI003EBA07A7
MPSHRSLRMAEAIREVVSSAILFEVSDPRVSGITVLRSEVTGDLRNATVYVSIMGTEAEQAQAMRGLTSASGFLQAKVAQRLQTRTTPHLTFKRDEGIKKSIEMSKIIDEALAKDREGGETTAPDDPDDAPEDATP